jgi:hypothetical protein
MNTEARNANILMNANRGMSITKIASMNKLSRRQVGRILKSESVKEAAINAVKNPHLSPFKPKGKKGNSKISHPQGVRNDKSSVTPLKPKGKSAAKGDLKPAASKPKAESSLIEKQKKVAEELSLKRDMSAKRKIEHDSKVAAEKHKVLSILSAHIGSHKAIHMPDLYQKVYNKPWHDKISDTRQIREIINEIRNEGIAICSKTDMSHGGYYLASADSELIEYLNSIKRRALKALAMYSKIKKCALSETLGQLMLEYK